MDWLWRCTELATTITGTEPIRLPCVGYMKAMVYVHKVNRRELLQWILSTARNINNVALLCKVTSSLVTQVRKYIQADEGHFEQFTWALNGESVAVYLTTYVSKCTMLLFRSQFIYSTLKTQTLELFQIWPMCVWCFWLRISSGIKSWSTDLNSWDILYNTWKMYLTLYGKYEGSP
jgi:hypothetical protein